MLSHFSSNNFLNINKPGFFFNGVMLMENLKKEWRINNVFQCDEPTLEVTNSDEYEFSKLSQIIEKLPFSIASFKNISDSKSNDLEEDNISQFFKPQSYINMKKTTFCYPSNSTTYFHKQQRDRKIWWRKLSSLPGRFRTTEIVNDENGNMSSDITAEFDWGIQQIENINCNTAIPNLQIKDGRKTVPIHTVTCECKLEVATLVYMCDAFEKVDEKSNAITMRFHRKLSPFNVTFAISATSAMVSKDLMDLALVLARKIRKIGVSCLLLPDTNRQSLDLTFLRADAIGIPFTIVLNDKTLEAGIIAIRSRDTTLKEQSHIGVVVQYIEQLMKNY